MMRYDSDSKKYAKIAVTLVIVASVVVLAATNISANPASDLLQEDGREGQLPVELLLNPTAKAKLKEAIKAAGKAPTSQERAKIHRMLMPIANHLAVRFLYTEVAERARANPTKPGHQAMDHVLKSKHEMSSIEARVKNKLVNEHSGEWAEKIYENVPTQFRKILPALATEAAQAATTKAFNDLKSQMLAAEKNPLYMKHLKPADPRM